MTLMAKKRDDRYQSAREVDRELARLKGIVTATQTVATIPENAPETETPEPTELLRSRGRPMAAQAWKSLSKVSLSPGVIALLAGLGLLVGAALGWSDRPANLLAGGEVSKPSALWLAPSWQAIPRKPTARDQLRYAQLEARPGDRPAAFLAVPGFFPGESEWSLLAYTHLARMLFDQLDLESLQALADSIEGSPDSAADARRGRLADVCRAAAAALDNRPADAMQFLTARTPAPSYFEPGMAELSLEVVDWARGSPDAQAQASQWANLREDLLQALRFVTFDPAERFDPGRRRSSSGRL